METNGHTSISSAPPVEKGIWGPGMFVTTRLITDCGDQRICVVIKLPARF